MALAVVAAGCGGMDGGGGGGAGGDAAECATYASQLSAVARSHASCTTDSDCHWLADGCLGMCATFVNSDGLQEAHDIIAAAAAANCNAGCECSAQQPRCNAGTCGGLLRQ